MTWFRRKRRLPIPTFKVAPPVDPKPEPKPEPIEVVEVRDPTDSMVMRIKDLIKLRFK